MMWSGDPPPPPTPFPSRFQTSLSVAPLFRSELFPSDAHNARGPGIPLHTPIPRKEKPNKLLHAHPLFSFHKQEGDTYYGYGLHMNEYGQIMIEFPSNPPTYLYQAALVHPLKKASFFDEFHEKVVKHLRPPLRAITKCEGVCVCVCVCVRARAYCVLRRYCGMCVCVYARCKGTAHFRLSRAQLPVTPSLSHTLIENTVSLFLFFSLLSPAVSAHKHNTMTTMHSTIGTVEAACLSTVRSVNPSVLRTRHSAFAPSHSLFRRPSR